MFFTYLCYYDKIFNSIGVLTQVSKLPVGDFYLYKKNQSYFRLKFYIKFEMVRTDFSMEGPTGFEPALRELQSRALPLGYEPK